MNMLTSNLNQLLLNRKSLDVEILECLKNSKEPMACSEIYDSLTNAPDTRTVSLEVGTLKQKGFVAIAYMAKSPPTNRDVAHYQIIKAGEDHLKSLERIGVAIESTGNKKVAPVTSAPDVAVAVAVVEAATTAAPPENLVPQKSKALQFLEYIEAHPNTAGVDIEKIINISNIRSYLKDHMARGHVVCEYPETEPKKPHYSLAKGLTAADIYSGRARLNQAAQENAIAEKLIPKFGESKPLDIGKLKVEPVPRYAGPIETVNATLLIDDPEAFKSKLEIEAENQADEYDEELMLGLVKAFMAANFKKETTKPKTRFALTSDDTLMIIDGDTTVELDKEATNTLFDFIDTVGMVFTHGHEVGGAVL